MASVITCPHVPPAPHPEPPDATRLRGVPQERDAVGPPPALPELRSRGLLRQLPGKHATKHARRTDHPVIQLYEPGEDWGWCYVESRELGPFPPARRA